MSRYSKQIKFILSSNITFFFFCLACIWLFLTFIVGIAYVPSGSMESTIMTGDFVLVNKLAYLVESPHRGDIVQFKSDELNLYLCKRIVGLENETVSFHNGYVYIDGEKLDESTYLPDSIKTYSHDSFDVPSNSYFMLGDNRCISGDSRYFASPYISKDKLVGKVIFIIPFSKF